MGEQITCGRCGRALPPDAFRQNPKLVYGRAPWCSGCMEQLRTVGPPEAADMRMEYRRAYARAYQSRKRSATLLRDKRLLTDPASGDYLGLTYIRNRGIARASGPWRLCQAGEAIMTDFLGADASVVVVTGRGGGRGKRRQKSFRAEAPVDVEAWEEGLERLAESWQVEIVGRLGRLA